MTDPFEFPWLDISPKYPDPFENSLLYYDDELHLNKQIEVWISELFGKPVYKDIMDELTSYDCSLYAVMYWLKRKYQFTTTDGRQLYDRLQCRR
jgi:hypothetical protein